MRKSNVWQSLFLGAALLLSFTACSDEEKNVPKVIIPEPVELTMGFDASVNTLNLGDESTYEIKGDVPEWLTVKLEEFSEDGSNILQLIAASNTGSEERTANFEVITASNKFVVTLTQSGITQRGLYILSEAGWNQKKSDIAYYDITNDELHEKFFSEVNGRTLGDVGNDLFIYGSKMYCLVSEQEPGSKDGVIEVIDPKTCKSIKQIPFVVNEETGEQDIPRRFIFEDGKGYITGFSGVVARLDTLSLAIDAVAQLAPIEGEEESDGLKTEGITAYDKKLYVANSGYGSGHTVSVVDMATMKELHKIEVPTNPVNMLTVGDEIYLQTSSVFVDPKAPANLHILNPETEEIVHTFDREASKLAVMGGNLYTGNFSWDTYADQSSIINLATKEVTPLEFSDRDMCMVYSFNANPLFNEYYIGSQGDDVIIVNGEDNTVAKKMKVKVPYISTVTPVMW